MTVGKTSGSDGNGRHFLIRLREARHGGVSYEITVSRTKPESVTMVGFGWPWVLKWISSDDHSNFEVSPQHM